MGAQGSGSSHTLPPARAPTEEQNAPPGLMAAELKRVNKQIAESKRDCESYEGWARGNDVVCGELMRRLLGADGCDDALWHNAEGGVTAASAAAAAAAAAAAEMAGLREEDAQKGRQLDVLHSSLDSTAAANQQDRAAKRSLQREKMQLQCEEWLEKGGPHDVERIFMNDLAAISPSLTPVSGCLVVLNTGLHVRGAVLHFTQWTLSSIVHPIYYLSVSATYVCEANNYL